MPIYSKGELLKELQQFTYCWHGLKPWLSLGLREQGLELCHSPCLLPGQVLLLGMEQAWSPDTEPGKLTVLPTEMRGNCFSGPHLAGKQSALTSEWQSFLCQVSLIVGPPLWFSIPYL